MNKRQKDNGIRNLDILEGNFQLPSLKNSFLILDHSHESARTLLRAFDIVRKKRRGGRKGGTTDQEQDILRAMIVLGAAGVDSMTKQLIRDGLPTLLKKEESVKSEFRKFVNRRLKSEGEDINPEDSRHFLTNLIVAESVRDQAVNEYVGFLTNSSLQSPEELIRATRALGIGQDEIKLDAEKLKRIFEVRNQIIHELDVKLGAPKRNRRVRKRSSMIDDTNYLLEFGEKLLKSGASRLSLKS